MFAQFLYSSSKESCKCTNDRKGFLAIWFRSSTRPYFVASRYLTNCFSFGLSQCPVLIVFYCPLCHLVAECHPPTSLSSGCCATSCFRSDPQKVPFFPFRASLMCKLMSFWARYFSGVFPFVSLFFFPLLYLGSGLPAICLVAWLNFYDDALWFPALHIV